MQYCYDTSNLLEKTYIIKLDSYNLLLLLLFFSMYFSISTSSSVQQITKNEKEKRTIQINKFFCNYPTYNRESNNIYSVCNTAHETN